MSEMDRLLQDLVDSTCGIKLHDYGSFFHKQRQCFTGTELLNWMLKAQRDACRTNEQALQMAQRLMDAGVLNRVDLGSDDSQVPQRRQAFVAQDRNGHDQIYRL